MRLLAFGVCLCDRGSRLAQTKSQLPEQSLALPHTQLDPVLALDPCRQRLSIPQIPAQASLARHAAQNGVDLLELLMAQPPGPPRSLALQQSGQSHLLELMDPILYRSRGVPQQFRRLRAGHALRYKQHTVEPVIIARFFRASDLILQSEHDGCGVRDAEWSHSSMRPEIAGMRNYL